MSLAPTSFAPTSENARLALADTTRFAPSPTGYLHLGHAFAARFAAERGQRFLLRLEDIDATRCKPEFSDSILEDLAWLGLSWEPDVWHQSQRLAAYQSALDCLRERDLLYPCFCTRKEIQAEIAAMGGAPHPGLDGPAYPGTCRQLSPSERDQRLADGQAHCWRLDTARAAAQAGHLTWHNREAGPQTADLSQVGDVVLARKDTPSAYHLAVVVDDAAQGVSLVTRGLDLRAATHLHRLLQALLALPVPCYAFHPLLLDAAGQRFAKRNQSATIRAMREAGHCPADVWQAVDHCPQQTALAPGF